MLSVSSERYDISTAYVVMLSNERLASSVNFNSNDGELNDFLRKDALGYQNLHLGTTYLLLRRSDNKLLAYTTLSMGALKLPEKKEEFMFVGKELGEYPKDFPNQFPALLLGKLATNKREEGRGAASLLLDFAVHTALEQRQAVGCAFLVAHAYAKPGVVAWYSRKLFKSISQKTEGRQTVPMYFELGV